MSAVELKKAYERPALRKLSPGQVKKIVLNHAREFLELVLRVRSGSNGPPQLRKEKEYEQPTMRKLTPEQAKLLLLGHASVGSQGAKDVLELLFPEPEASSNQDS